MEEKKIIEVTEMYAIVAVPENTFRIKVTSILPIDGEPKEAYKILEVKDVREGFNEYEDGYMRDDDESSDENYVVSVPEDVISFCMECSVLDGTASKTVKVEYSGKELREALRKAEDSYIPPDATFYLSESAKEE